MTQIEFASLEYMMSNANQVVTAAMILENVASLRDETTTNSVGAHINSLRGRIDRDGRTSRIRTIRDADGVAYLICNPGQDLRKPASIARKTGA